MTENNSHIIGKFEGKMLISLPSNPSRIFQNTVVYIHTDDDVTGSTGFIVNFPVRDDQAIAWSEEIDWQWPEKLKYGGPSHAQLGYVLHSNDYAQESTIRLNDDISYTSGKGVLSDIARGIGPIDFRLLVGHCSWYPYQLEDEVSKRYWKVIDYDPSYFFSDLGKEEIWDMAVDAEVKSTIKRMFMLDESR